MRAGSRWQLSPDAAFSLEATRQARGSAEGANEVLVRAAVRF